MAGITSRVLTFSPSDLTAYLECEHLARLDLEVARGELVKPLVEDPQAELIRRKGAQHEQAYLDGLRQVGSEPARDCLLDVQLHTGPG